MKLTRLQLFCAGLAGYRSAVLDCCPSLYNKCAGAGFLILINDLLFLLSGRTFAGLLPMIALLLIGANHLLIKFLQAGNQWPRLLFCVLMAMVLAVTAASGFVFILFKNAKLALSFQYLQQDKTAMVFALFVTGFLMLIATLPFVMIFAFRQSTYYQIKLIYAKKGNAATA